MANRRAVVMRLAIAFFVSLGVNAVFFFYGHEIVLFVINAKGGCFPWSPKEVEYYDGVTLCPGQSTSLKMYIVIPAKPGVRI